ncbi:hypothetical protein BH10ACI4_BH10ACI4_34510 [soil metagenome]
MTENNPEEFVCSQCGELHPIAMKYSVKVPQAAIDLPKDQLDERLVITPDQCVIDGKDFYLRGRLLVPVIGLEEPFVWGVWAEVGPTDFIRTNERWSVEGRELEPAFPGWLNTRLPLFGNTINLEVDVKTQVVGWRPQFTVRDQSHPLAREQRQGITLDRVREIAEQIAHLHA